MSARKPISGAYEPAPEGKSSPANASPSNNGSANGSAAANRRPNGAKPAARKPMRGGLSAEEYARTTKEEADTTAVIPVVKDDVPSKDAATPAPPLAAKPTPPKSAPAKPTPARRPRPKSAAARNGNAGNQPAKKPNAGPVKPAVDKAAEPAKLTGDQAWAKPATSGADEVENTMIVDRAQLAAAAKEASSAAAKAPAVEPTESVEGAPATPTPAKPGNLVNQGKPVAPSAPAKSATKPVELVPAASTTSTAVQPAVTDARPAGGTQAVMRLKYVDPWSVTRLAFVVSVALMVVSVVATVVFWLVMWLTGVWGSINSSVLNVLSDTAGGFDIGNYLGFGRLVGFALLASALNVVFMTALATIAAHLYNMSAQILGGIKLTFGEDR